MLKKFFLNTKNPKGTGGSIMLWFMNWGHGKMAKWGLQYLNIRDNERILDIGCGGGANISRMLKKASGLKLFGIDYSELSVEKSIKEISDLQGVQRTLMLPLWGRAVFSRRYPEILDDKEAISIVNALDYDFSEIEKAFGEYGGLLYIIRGRKIDDTVKHFILKHPNATGNEVPLFDQFFNTVIFTVTFLMALLSINLSGCGFRWFSLVWSALFLLLNIAHLAEAIFVEKFDLSQVCLLSFVLVVNVLLIVTLWKSLKKLSVDD
jgi:SAM-dependent methyltransferase